MTKRKKFKFFLMLETFCFVSFWGLVSQPGGSFSPLRLTLWVCSPVDVTAAKGARREISLTSWPSPCSAAKMKTEVTEANRRCGPSINHKLMSQRNVRNIFCCWRTKYCLMTLNKHYRSMRCNCSWFYDLDLCIFDISVLLFTWKFYLSFFCQKKKKFNCLIYWPDITSLLQHTCCITIFTSYTKWDI